MYTDKELAKLISEVETEFSSYLAKAETTLAKSEDAPPAKADKKDDKKPEAKDSKEEPADKAPAAPEATEESAPAPTDEAPAAPADDQAPPMDAAPADESHGYDEDDMAAMTEMYASMSRPELIAHHDAVKAALDAMSAPEQTADVPMDQAAAPAAPAMDAAPMQKSETISVGANVLVASAETELLKSELASKTGEITELKKSVEVMTTFIEKLISKKAAPTGKAITSLETINKNEDGNSKQEDVTALSKQEVTARLMKKASDPKLEKSDRDLINKFYESGTINLNGISHLLK